jgi:hypothetical protein
MTRPLQSICVLIAGLLVAQAAWCADTLEAALGRMDKEAPTFHGLTADVQMVTYTKVIDDKTTETGQLHIQKLGPSDLRAIIAFKGADKERTVALLGKTVKIYYPQLKGYNEYDLGSQSQVANQLLLLGFGSSGSDLAKSYDIQLAGSETVNGQETSKLVLTPKDASVREHISKVELWIPLNSGHPVQQQFFDPPSTGNWRMVTYTNINMNPAMKGKLDLVLPKGVKKLPS